MQRNSFIAAGRRHGRSDEPHAAIRRQAHIIKNVGLPSSVALLPGDVSIDIEPQQPIISVAKVAAGFISAA
ncbi:MAG TPA: hypothetical protein VNM37_13630, partial [Candidatus Dormibacteraeota bacterium]|nr:hypothetical protein [Candidatus Dormibacteraeota bacterium]